MGSIAASETVVVKNMARELFHFSYFILIAPRDTMFGLGQLLWHITTLEALLGEPREVTATLAKRVALITEQTNKARGEVRKQVQELYDFRSSIVHGKTTLRTNRIHEGHLRKARNLSRLVLLWFISFLSAIQAKFSENIPTRDELLSGH